MPNAQLAGKNKDQAWTVESEAKDTALAFHTRLAERRYRSGPLGNDDSRRGWLWMIKWTLITILGFKWRFEMFLAYNGFYFE
ncbi:hypothetical protein N7478_000224 [Penicillium angulare]|uniref:uncharacterized protein n=1 Tax=Penicillium angulare TaxID=116970 RepID=UPI002541772F|nr:uncharacterized protein N7478_000224 [Penicillium angulare]KAJ5290973.1 hypothetical protein N7478_000224 [Penicillium angulare]